MVTNMFFMESAVNIAAVTLSALILQKINVGDDQPNRVIARNVGAAAPFFFITGGLEFTGANKFLDHQSNEAELGALGAEMAGTLALSVISGQTAGHLYDYFNRNVVQPIEMRPVA